jgi:hypothetical protein
MMAETPTLYVCHGDDGGPRRYPWRRVQEALRAAGIDYEKVIAAHGIRSRSSARARGMSCARRPETRSWQALKLPGGTIITHSPAILAWISRQADSHDAGLRYRLEAEGAVLAHARRRSLASEMDNQRARFRAVS